MKEFIALHNRTVSRDEIQTVIALAKEQNNTEVIYRLSKILNDHPDSNRFNINIINYPQETTQQVALAGTRHSGDYREALDECGRLKKGWHFVDGKVVKVQKRSGLLSQYTEKEFGQPFTKTLKAKFKELNWKYDRKNKRYYTPVPENEAEKEQQSQMFAFIEQEKSRIEANGNFTSAPSSAKSAPSDLSSNKTTLYETFAKKLLQIKNSNNDISSNELEEFLYSFGQQYYKGKETPYKFWYSKEIKPIGTLSAYKNHPLFNKVKNIAPHHAGYITTKRGEEILDTLIEAIEAIKKQYGYDYLDFSKFWNIATEKPNDDIAFLSAAGIDYFPEAPDDQTQGLGKPVPAADIYKMVTDKIIGMLKSASPTDYHRAWKDDAFFIPLNYESKKPYRGVNRLLLQERIGFAGAFRNPYFLTFKQIKKHKGTLKKGAKGYEVIYYSIRYVVPADKNSGRKAYSSTNAQKVLDFLHKYKLSEDIVGRIPMIRYYNVYNGADIENIDFKLDELQIGRAVPDSATENRAAQLIVENYPNPPAIKNEGNQAYYNPASDYIKLPKQEQFDTVNDYYRTLFHELTHSTGHNKRLNRGIHLMLEKDDYAKEELVAEFGAVFLSAWAGIMWYNNKNHAAYLKGWNSAIKEAQNDNKFLMRAASLAQQATDYILALDKDGNPSFLKKLQGKKASKNTPKTPTDKSAPSDTESYFLQREEQVKRAELIRIARKQGYTEEEIRQRAKKLGYDNIDLLINLSYLNPKGDISSAYIYYPDNETPTITKMVNWAGEARRKYPFLEDEHEQQFFDLYEQQFYEKKDKKYLFEKIEELASKYHSFEELMKKHNIKGNVFFFDKLIAAVKVSLRKSNYKDVPDWYIRYNVPIDTDKPLTKENKDFLKKYFAAEVSKVVKPFALKEKYTTWVEFKQKGLELLSKIITPTDKSAPSDSSPKIPALGFLFGKYPEISTDTFKDMKVSELRAFTLSYYLTHLKGKKVVIENHLKEVIFTTKAGRKIAKGEAMYKEKAAVIEHLEELIKNSTYNNWGSRKTQDTPNILGYLNFKSKITIDGEKRHVRIAISLTRERKTELKNVEVGKKKSASFRKATVVNPQDGRNETLSIESVAKTVPNSTLSAPEVFVEHSPDPSEQFAPSITPRNNSLANKMATLQNRTFETFIIAEPQMQAFLGDVERKNTGSTAITITGGAGSGKTRFAFQFINALAQNYKVGHASLEEQPDSKLYFDKVQQYLDQTAQANVEAPEIENMQDLQALIERNDVIVIDSFTKIREWDRNFLLDRDLRKKYNGKLFLIIFQQTVAGNMRGGTTSEFDGDIILYTQVFPDYRENYIYPSKNRYNSTPREQLRYSVYHQQLLPSESTPPDSSPVTSNTYEVIY